MTRSTPNRRVVLQTGGAAVAAMAAQLALPDFVFPNQGDDEELAPFLNMPRTPPNRLDWETLDSWITPQDQVFSVQHYGIPEFDASKYKLNVGGLVKNAVTLSLDAIKKRPRQEQLMTLECSGNGAGKGFINAIYNSKWTGAPLAPLLEECQVDPQATEVVFFGVDRKEETLRKGTNRELTVDVPFGRSMSVADAMKLNLLLAYERNGKPLEKRNGAPLRLIVPGWYGIANVKWLRKIELRDRRYMGRYMGRDYVTVRGEKRGDEVVFVETSVGRMNLKSIIARVMRQPAKGGKVPAKAYGAAWSDGTAVERVEVKVDDGPWRRATLDKEPRSKFCWTFFSIDLGSLAAGKHSLVSRAIDADGRAQPSAEDDEIALKKTYWEAYQQWPREIELEA
ncbi:MAG: molybdopterin-dependent oxidoreductase [Pirellulaceae bacterium]|nr:molybdopterin-dependent oxidoreductase [Pirellulaceae bacterium]MDP7018164.1 molybdopterin-dependent oxidoreductase [Pirellulaceae bacterium]